MYVTEGGGNRHCSPLIPEHKYGKCAMFMLVILLPAINIKLELLADYGTSCRAINCG
jgi:hypothetical protein